MKMIRNLRRLIYLNGKLIPQKEAKVASLDAGFLYGEGLFETMRAYRAKVLFLEAHLKRLLVSAPVVKIKSPKLREMKKAVEATIKANRLKDAYVRLTLWKGTNRVNLLVLVKRLTPIPQKIYQKGFRAVISCIRQNEYSPLSRIKSLNYLLNRLARYKAESKDADEAILLNTQGYLAEGSRANIFIVKKKRLITPCLECGCLAGITRGKIIELAREINIKVEQRWIKPDELFGAEEAFLTNSLIEIMPLTALDGRKIGKGRPGELTLHLHKRYRGLTKLI